MNTMDRRRRRGPGPGPGPPRLLYSRFGPEVRWAERPITTRPMAVPCPRRSSSRGKGRGGEGTLSECQGRWWALACFDFLPHADAASPHRIAMVSMMATTPHPLDSPAEGEGDELRRVRKPYTITRSRESWTEPEHDKFLEALQLFDRDWKKIEAYVGSKTVIQIRSHAQKYFLKVQKNGTGEHLPPPRPKRKAAHPYPHKASTKAPQVDLPQQASHIMEQGCVITMDASAVATNSSANDAFPSWDSGLAQHFSPRHTQGVTNNCSSSVESQSGTWPTSEAIEQEIMLPALRAMPDFARVYNFLGSVFDPETSGHLQRLREMDPIDVETVVLLMKNLSLNLTGPNFEAHRRLLSSDGSSMDQVKRESIGDLGSTHTLHVPFMVTSK